MVVSVTSQGCCQPAAADGRVFVLDYIKHSGNVANSAGQRDQLTGIERVLCLDARSGQQLWQHSYDVTYGISYPAGPRCTPIVQDGLVYTLGAEGNLICFQRDLLDPVPGCNGQGRIR